VLDSQSSQPFVPRDETWEREGVDCSSSKSRDCDHEEERETVMRLKAAADTIIVAGEEVKKRQGRG
jgi:hypothetical protein